MRTLFLTLVTCLFLLPAAYAQQSVSGRVLDETGAGLASANVVVKGTTRGALTGDDGSFTIRASAGEVIVVSFIGYQAQEITIGSETTNIVINMTAVDQRLDEVVVVGYGTQRRSDLTGAVASLNAEAFRDMPLQSVEQGLQGRLAGVQVTQTSGAPGGPLDIQIRGVGSTGDTQPLYVIDGFPVTVGEQGALGSSPLNTLNPNDIESIEVLKDASAAAIYGARGANGVIVITTKRGQAGKLQVNYDGYVGIQRPWRTLDLLGESDYRAFLIDAYAERGINPGDDEFPGAYATGTPGNNTDWQSEMFQTGSMTDHNVNLSGGTQNARFSLGVGYLDQQGVLRGTDFQRFTVRLNSDFSLLGDRVRIGNSLQLGQTVQNRERNLEGRREFEHMIKNTAGVPVLDDRRDGGYGQAQNADGHDAPNPVAISDLVVIQPRRYRALGSVFAEVDILPGLTYRLNAGMDLFLNRSFEFTPRFEGVRGNPVTSRISESYGLGISPLVENTLNYQLDFGQHSFSALIGYTAQQFIFNTVSTNLSNLPNNEVRAAGIGATGFSRSDTSALLSQLGRLTYNFADRYLLTVNVRRDGSSKLDPDNRYDVFPSASVGWRVSNEAFMQSVAAVSDLKIRASWGQIGNEKTLSNYPTVATLNNAALYTLNGVEVPGVALSFLPNPDIRWETAEQLDIGIDLGMFRNKFLFTADYFDRKTIDLIVPVPVPASLGFTDVAPSNAGTVRNRGVELSATFRQYEGDFRYDFSVNGTFLQNEVLSLGDGQPIAGGGAFTLGNTTLTREGFPIGGFFGFQTDGLFQSQAEIEGWATQENETAPGDIRFVDQPGEDDDGNPTEPDGIITDDDRVLIGNPNPNFLLGFVGNLNYKNFDLSFTFQGVFGNDINNALLLWLEGMNQNFNYRTTVNDRYQVNPNSGVPRAVIGDPNRNTRFSDRYLEDGSFVRLRVITLGYTLPEAVAERVGISRGARFYLTGQNLLTFTNYSGFDPEIGGLGSNIARGIDIGTYPQARSFLVGVQLNL